MSEGSIQVADLEAGFEPYRTRIRKFFCEYAEPRLRDYDDRGTGAEFWRAAAAAGVTGTMVPREYGGAGQPRLAALILSEELGRWPGGASIGGGLSGDLATTFLIDHGTEEQKRRWFPEIRSGVAVQAMCLTEPQAGSDAAAISTSAVRVGDEYVLNGVKGPIMQAANANLLYVIAKTDPKARGAGMSIFIVPGDAPGLSRRRLTTIGYRGGDTAELHFNDVRVPASNLLGREGGAFAVFQGTMKFDRMQICARSLGAAESAFDLTLERCRARQMFGQRLIDMQNTQFVLARMQTEIKVSRAYYEQLLGKLVRGEFDDADGAHVKAWLPEVEGRVLDACVQLWGSSGWMDDNPVARMFTAARAQRIHAGPTELMLSVLGRRLADGGDPRR